MLRSWLAAGADPERRDAGGKTALALAAALGRTDVVKALLEHGAAGNAANRTGAAPLHFAVRLLLARAADLEVVERPGDMTPLLLDAGADPDLRDSEGRSAADIAARTRNRTLVALFAGLRAAPATGTAGTTVSP